METKTNMQITETVTMAEALAKFPQILKGWNELTGTYRNWLIQFVSPSILIGKYLEAESKDVRTLHPMYPAYIDSGRFSGEYLTMRYAVETLLTKNKLFYKTNPGTQYKTTANSAEDQYLIDLLQVSYPLIRGYQSLQPEERAWLRGKLTPSELADAFQYGVTDYNIGALNTGSFANINAAQIARGVWSKLGEWMGNKRMPA